MKKIYTSALFALIGTIAFSQSFFVQTDYRGAFAPAPTAMWTDGWVNWDPQNTNYGISNVTVTANITNNTTWTSNNIYLLSGPIYVKNGATLTIQPGTIIMGDKSTLYSGLYITQGSRLIAQGTVTQPIVFTSNQAAGARDKGDWGGVILMGRAANNQPGGIANIEGIAPSADTQFGGGTNPDDNDNSGILSYVRIEFGGQIFQPDKEINGLTLGSIGRATQIDHIQTSFTNDDAFEWFGGTVNCSYLVSYRNLDDDFDTDFGFTGNVQFGLIVRDPNISDLSPSSTSEGFESDNDASGSAATPQTKAIFSNITAIGPYRGTIVALTGNAAGYRRAARIRRNSSLSIYNSLFMDFRTGLYLDNTNAGSEANATNGTLRFRSNIIAGNSPGRVTEKIAGSLFPLTTFFATNNNDSIAATTGILTTPYDYLAPDYRPASNSPLLSDMDFADAHILPYVLTAPAVGAATQSYCQDATPTQLSATATNGNTLNWYTVAQGGVGSSTAPTPSTTTAGTFNFYVSQMNADGNESPRTLITITVNATPATPTIASSGSTTFCTGGSVDLTASTATAYDWSTNATSPTITVSTSGNYTVTITDANGCEATSSAVTVNVSNAPVPTVAINGATTLCEGETVTLTASTADSYTWSNNATTQSITVSTAGTYHVTTTNTDACDGVGQSANVVITVNPQPEAIGAIGTITNFVVNFTNTSTNATSYSWDFGDFTSSSAAQPTHAFAASGAYTVTLTAINGNCTDDTTFTVNIVVGLDELAALNNAVIYPNPASDNATLAIELTEQTALDVVVMNANGQIVQTVAAGDFEAGKHTLTIDASTFAQGLYYTVIRSNEATQTIKLSVVK
jgi:PKD repeat protein